MLSNNNECRLQSKQMTAQRMTTKRKEEYKKRKINIKLKNRSRGEAEPVCQNLINARSIQKRSGIKIN